MFTGNLGTALPWHEGARPAEVFKPIIPTTVVTRAPGTVFQPRLFPDTKFWRDMAPFLIISGIAAFAMIFTLR